MAASEETGWGSLPSSDKDSCNSEGWAGIGLSQGSSGGEEGGPELAGAAEGIEMNVEELFEAAAAARGEQAGCALGEPEGGGAAAVGSPALWVQADEAVQTPQLAKAKLKASNRSALAAKALLASLPLPAVAAIEDGGEAAADDLEEHDAAGSADAPDAGEPLIADVAPPAAAGPVAAAEAPAHAGVVAGIRLERLPAAGLAALGASLNAYAAVVSAAADPLSDGISAQWKRSTASHFMFEKKHQVGMVAEAKSIGVGLEHYQTMLHASACAGLLFHRAQAAESLISTHRQLVVSGAKPMCITEHLRYDETPMRARLRDPERTAAGPAGGGEIVPAGGPAPIAVQCISTHVVKVLQTERWVSLLYGCADGSYLFLKSWVPCWLQSMSDGKAETYFRSLMQSSFDMPPEITASFARRQRQVCTDRDAAVLRAERHIALYQPGATTLHTTCEVHIA